MSHSAPYSNPAEIEEQARVAALLPSFNDVLILVPNPSAEFLRSYANQRFLLNGEITLTHKESLLKFIRNFEETTQVRMIPVIEGVLRRHLATEHRPEKFVYIGGSVFLQGLEEELGLPSQPKVIPSKSLNEAIKRNARVLALMLSDDVDETGGTKMEQYKKYARYLSERAVNGYTPELGKEFGVKEEEFKEQSGEAPCFMEELYDSIFPIEDAYHGYQDLVREVKKVL
jgi:hypothetical protein